MRAVLVAILIALALPALAQRSEDDEAALLVAEGRKALARKRYDAAATALDRALAVNPRRLDAYLLRAGVYAATREHDKAVALLRRAQALDPTNLEVTAALGAQLTFVGQIDEGVRLLESVVQRAPDSYQAQATLGRHYASQGRWREAAAALRAYLSSRPTALAGEDQTFKTALADAQLRAGNATAARDLFEELVEADPKNTKARLGAAWAAAAIDCKSALPKLQELEALAEKVPDLWLVIGRCRLQVGQIAEARDLADRYLAKVPSGGAGHALRGEAILAGGNPFEARRELDKALKLDPDNHRVLLRWARATRENGAPADAVVKLRNAGPPDERDEPDWTTEIASCMAALGQNAEAIKLLEPHVERYPDARPARLALGSAMLATGDAAGALPHLEVAAGPGGPPKARGMLADALVAVGTAELADPDGAGVAEKHLARAVEAGAGDAALVNLGIARLVLGDTKGALAPLERAARSPKNVPAVLAYGRALALAGKPNEAILTLESAQPGGDTSRIADLALELAAVDIESSDPGRAVGRLESAMGRAPAAQRARLEDAMVPAARAAATRSMAQGNFSAAVKLLERAEKLAGPRGELAIAIRCDLALATTAAGDRDGARARLRNLEGARCPYAAPGDELAVPILTAVNTRPDDNRVDAALLKLSTLSARARGPAARLSADATRWLAARAAAAALSRGRLDRARRYLVLAAKVPGASPELAYDAAVLELEVGRIDEARSALQGLADQVPEALVALAIAEEREGDPRKALELYRKAADRGAKVGELDEWIAGKERLLGEEK